MKKKKKKVEHKHSIEKAMLFCLLMFTEGWTGTSCPEMCWLDGTMSTWLSCRYPCTLQRSCTRCLLMVPSISNDIMTPWKAALWLASWCFAGALDWTIFFALSFPHKNLLCLVQLFHQTARLAFALMAGKVKWLHLFLKMGNFLIFGACPSKPGSIS